MKFEISISEGKQNRQPNHIINYPMKQFLSILLLLISLKLWSTYQVRDIVIFENDTLFMETHVGLGNRVDSLFESYPNHNATNCFRGYRAEFLIEENQLYLTNILSCEFPEDRNKSDLKILYEELYNDGKVLVQWFSGSIFIDGGRISYQSRNLQIYEKQINLILNKGVITEFIKINDNNIHQSVYTNNIDSLKEFFYSHFNWKIFNDTGLDSLIVLVNIDSGNNRKPNNVKIIRPSDMPLLRNEIERVIMSLPDWDSIENFGITQRISWVFPIKLSKELVRNYSK